MSVRSVYARRLAVLATSAALTVTGLLATAPAAQAAMPTPVSAATARTYLAALTVKAEGPPRATAGTSSALDHPVRRLQHPRDRPQAGRRERRHGLQLCRHRRSWYSEYDGATWTAASDLDIDHMVPLAEAWRSGASSWTTAQRQSFANDLTRPQLIAVTDNVNQAKGDLDPAKWLPSRTAYRCTYVRAWVHVKYHWNLSVDSAEKSALQSVLNGC